VATVVYSPAAVRRLERLLTTLADEEPVAARKAAAAIREAIELLASHPLIGRRVEGGIRELVISFGETGYVALYRFLAAKREVRILALRHQRELGYRD